MATPPHHVERIVKQEVLTDTLKSDIRELKAKLVSLDDEVSGLVTSQQVQLTDLTYIKKALESLDSTIKAMTSTVKRAETSRELDFDLSKTASGFTIAKIKSYFAIGVFVAGVVWGVYGITSKMSTPDTHLIDEIHKNQVESAKK